jgi:hypothetical protein
VESEKEVCVKRILALSALVAMVVAAAIPATAANKSKVTYALAGEARALELALGEQGLTLGLAMARADSTPSVIGVGAGQCTVLGNNPDPDSLPCNEGTTAKSNEKDHGKAGETCAGPALPAELDSVLSIELACGSSLTSLIAGKIPTTLNTGKVAEVRLETDLTGLVPQVQDVKETLINELQTILDQAPDEIENALDQVLDSVDVGQAVQIKLGPASSNVVRKGNTLTVESAAAGAEIGLVGIPDLDTKGNPIPGTSQALEDGLLIIQVGRSDASATLDQVSAAATSEANPALVTIKVRDITKLEPTYQTISVAPGQTVTILEGTPAESTISAAAATKTSKPGEASAAADAVRLDLLKGVQGGIHLGLGRATAAVSVKKSSTPPAPRDKVQPQILPITGGTDHTGLALMLLVTAAGVFFVARRRFGTR